ncbi:unnamed protein product, partial [Pylaiella littoralis]
LEEAAAGTGQSATAAARTTGGVGAYQGSEWSQESQPAEDSGRRPAVPAGVGPITNTVERRGEAGDSYPTGIAAAFESRSSHDKQHRVNPPVLRAEKGGFPLFKHEFLLKANHLDISQHFVGEGTRAVPVGDPAKRKDDLLREGFTAGEIREARLAWTFLD